MPQYIVKLSEVDRQRIIDRLTDERDSAGQEGDQELRMFLSRIINALNMAGRAGEETSLTDKRRLSGK